MEIREGVFKISRRFRDRGHVTQGRGSRGFREDHKNDESDEIQRRRDLILKLQRNLMTFLTKYF